MFLKLYFIFIGVINVYGHELNNFMNDIYSHNNDDNDYDSSTFFYDKY